jgi:hypothetical protein
MKQPRVKFLTVIWGERYIERFCSLSLPSFLASGNLPSLAVGTELEVVIMTREADQRYFEESLAFHRLLQICCVRFVRIDDLITTAAYGVTLTLAYARPIIACGDDMLNIHFVFMNADFVLADGSLRSLSRHIHGGRSIVLGPSYRAIAEEVEPALETLVNQDSAVLEVPPRDMVRLSLPHPHRTTVAKTMNQQVFCSTHPNQLFWQVDQNTVLGRYFLIFMLCLKPERVIDKVNCFCDYSFIPEFCPSGDEVAMGDSDEFFMLEMQSRAQEQFMLRQGVLPYRKIASSLQDWTTAEHRRIASYDIVFHSDKLPEGLAKAKKDADLAVGSIRRFLGTPRSHINHYYWVAGVEAWKNYRRLQGLTCEVPELAPYKIGLRAYYHIARHKLPRYLWRYARMITSAVPVKRMVRVLRRIERMVVDRSNARSIASSGWQMNQLLQMIRLDSLSKDEHKLIVGYAGNYRRFGVLPAGVRTIRSSSLGTLLESGQRYGQVVWFLESLQNKYITKSIKLVLSSLAGGATLHIVLDLSARRKNYLNAVNLVFQLGEFVGNRMRSASVRTVGGKLLAIGDRLNDYAARHLLRYARRRRLPLVPFLAPVTMVGMTLIYFANTLAFGGFGRKLTAYSWGAVISIDVEDSKSSAEETL